MLFSRKFYKYIVFPSITSISWFWNQRMEVGVAFFITIPNNPFTEILILIWQLFFSVGLKNLVSKRSLVSKLPRKFPQTDDISLNLKIRLSLVFVVFLHQLLNEQTGRSYFTQWDEWFPLLIRNSDIAKRNGQMSYLGIFLGYLLILPCLIIKSNHKMQDISGLSSSEGKFGGISPGKAHQLRLLLRTS